MAHDVFISYASEDRTYAESIVAALEAEGIRCWIAPRDILGGSSWQEAIVDAIPVSRVFLLVLSPHSITSSHVQTEVRNAFDQSEPKRLPILPFKVAAVNLDKVFRYMIGGYQILDASKAPLEGIPHLVRDVKRHVGSRDDVHRDVTTTAPPTVEPARAKGTMSVVLSYKRNVEPDELVLGFLEQELARSGYEVFVDRHIRVGIEWPQEIERRIRRADVVIPLLSAASSQSEMLTWEVQTAHDEAQRRAGRPRLLPVRIAYEGSLPSELANVLDRLQYFLWNGTYDNARLLDDLIDAFRGPEPIKPPRPIPIGGLPLDSESYLRRPTDDAFHSGLARRDSILLIRGARQMGKTSLLARGLQRAHENGARIAFTDFQRLNRSDLESPEALYKALGAGLADELELEERPEDLWNPGRAPNINFEHYLKTYVLKDEEAPVVWGLDEVDRLFHCPFGSEVFGLFRSWHNARTRPARQAAPWKRLTLAIAYATEAHLFITDLDQSPFNVGTTVTLEDFNAAQVVDLNIRYGTPLHDASELAAFRGLVGGQPYLVNRGLYELAENGLDLATLAVQAEREEGLFGDHLRRILVALANDRELLEDMQGVLAGKPRLSARNFYRLRAAGVVAGDAAPDARPRCPLYAIFLKKHLGIR